MLQYVCSPECLPSWPLLDSFSLFSLFSLKLDHLLETQSACRQQGSNSKGVYVHPSKDRYSVQQGQVPAGLEEEDRCPTQRHGGSAAATTPTHNPTVSTKHNTAKSVTHMFQISFMPSS